MVINVLAFNSSPNENYGSTARILNPFLDGMKEEGANVEVVFSNSLNIEPCKACTTDYHWESGNFCRIEDDMQMLYPKLKKADFWVFATPCYHNIINESLKNILDRLEPLFTPSLSMTNGFAPHMDNGHSQKGKIVLVSTSSMWDLRVFELISSHLEDVSMVFGREFAGALLRPHAWALSAAESLGIDVDDIYASLFQAGKDLVGKGKIPSKTINNISRELVPKNSFVSEINSMFRRRLQFE
jgi:hypothetical protein